MDAWIEAFELGFIFVFFSFPFLITVLTCLYYIITIPIPIFPLHFLIHSHVPFSNQIGRPSTCESRWRIGGCERGQVVHSK